MGSHRVGRSLPPTELRDPLDSPRGQVRSYVVHAIAQGALTQGRALPSVRALADRSGVAAMTVSKVNADLRQSRLVESRPGAGTHVADSPLARLGTDMDAGFWTDLDALLDRAARLGLKPSDLSTLVEARGEARSGAGPRPRLAMIGVTRFATRSSARRIASQLGGVVAITPVALGTEPEPMPEADRRRLDASDLVLTFGALRDRIAASGLGAPLLALRSTPTAPTRRALGSIPPAARVVAVSRYADCSPALAVGVRRYAPQAGTVTATDLDRGDLTAALAACDVLVMSAGAEAARTLAPARAARIDYCPVPDPEDVDRLVRPRLKSGRTAPTA